MAFNFKTKDLREAEKLQKAGGHLVAIKSPEMPLDPKTYIFEENYPQAKKMLGEKVEEKVEEKKEEVIVAEEKPKEAKPQQKKKGKGGKK